MKIFVTVKPNAKENKIDKIDDIRFSVHVKAEAKRNKANQATARLMAEYFGVTVSCVRILKGHTYKRKLVEIIGI